MFCDSCIILFIHDYCRFHEGVFASLVRNTAVGVMRSQLQHIKQEFRNHKGIISVGDLHP